MTWPNLFVVGAAKAGTTSLWRYLDQHPAIYMSPVKEPHYFSSFTPGLFPAVKDEGEYLELFRDAGDAPLRGEASASYLWDVEDPRRHPREVAGREDRDLAPRPRRAGVCVLLDGREVRRPAGIVSRGGRGRARAARGRVARHALRRLQPLRRRSRTLSRRVRRQRPRALLRGAERGHARRSAPPVLGARRRP